jgi:hypothetical protein
VRALFRVILLFLIAGIGGGSTLLDGCLVSCHPGAATTNARTGHCHVVSVAPAGSHLTSIPSCCHDASSGLTDRNDTGSNLAPPSLVAVNVFAIVSQPALQRLEAARYFEFLPEFNPVPTPLRL